MHNAEHKVCKTFFIHTLDISDQRIYTAVSKKVAAGISSGEGRGKHSNRPNKTQEDQLAKVRNHIKSFPCIESHYCRRDSNKSYLSPDLNVKKMYRLYVSKCFEDRSKPVSVSIYRRIFDRDVNLAFHHPVKDQCDLCTKYKNSSDAEKLEMKEIYDNHIRNKDKSRENKSKDKEQADQSQGKFISACFDL